MMNNTEKKAMNILQQWGWEPKRIENRAGHPDFICSKKRYVEVKRANRFLTIQENQLQSIQHITADNAVRGYKNNKVYIMVFSEDEEYLGIFQIKALDWVAAGIYNEMDLKIKIKEQQDKLAEEE